MKRALLVLYYYYLGTTTAAIEYLLIRRLPDQSGSTSSYYYPRALTISLARCMMHYSLQDSSAIFMKVAMDRNVTLSITLFTTRF